MSQTKKIRQSMIGMVMSFEISNMTCTFLEPLWRHKWHVQFFPKLGLPKSLLLISPILPRRVHFLISTLFFISSLFFFKREKPYYFGGNPYFSLCLKCTFPYVQFLIFYFFMYISLSFIF